MSTKQRSAMPGRHPVRPISATRCARDTDANWREWPKVNSRRNCPNVVAAYTPANNWDMPPERITSKSSMQSAPAAIPATIAATFPAGFAPAERTLVVRNVTLLATSPDKPACSAKSSTGTSPAHDTRFSSSNTATAPTNS